MKFEAVTEDRDLGFEALITRIKAADGFKAVVGVFEGVLNEETETPIAKYGGYHELGSPGGRVTEKAWMRKPVDTNTEHLLDVLERGNELIMFGEANVDNILQQLAVEVQGYIRMFITDIGLIDTGALRRAIVYTVLGPNETVPGMEFEEIG